MREFIQSINILCFSPNILKKNPYLYITFHSSGFLFLFRIEHAVFWDIPFMISCCSSCLSLVSLQFPLNCFQYTDTRIVTKVLPF